MKPRARAVVACLLLLGCTSPDGTRVVMPDASPGIGFDDLRYSAALHRVLVPAGRSGNLVLVDPDNLEVTAISGFSESGSYDGGHDFGVTSVDEGGGLLFVTDRTNRRLSVVNPATRTVVGTAHAGASPDYVRFVPQTNELWVTEPDASQIEVFSLPTGGDPNPTSVVTVAVDNGPESLVIDATRGLAYTHRWQASTVVIDVQSRKIVAEWPNGCASSRGLALDESRRFFFSACSEGTISVLDAADDGRILSSISRGAGYDVIGYSSSLGHLYAAGTACACLVDLGVSKAGELSLLGRFDATDSAHCAAADDHGHAWFCDPDGGQLFRVTDSFPRSR